MLYEKHILINRTSETVLRFLPPYLITKADVDTTIAALSSLIADAETAQAALAEEQVHG
jgi:acetylornithine aminotransferase/acetylornithine/N-succinyldiaminopimelate aminotransferase